MIQNIELIVISMIFTLNIVLVIKFFRERQRFIKVSKLYEDSRFLMNNIKGHTFSDSFLNEEVSIEVEDNIFDTILKVNELTKEVVNKSIITNKKLTTKRLTIKDWLGNIGEDGLISSYIELLVVETVDLKKEIILNNHVVKGATNYLKATIDILNILEYGLIKEKDSPYLN